MPGETHTVDARERVEEIEARQADIQDEAEGLDADGEDAEQFDALAEQYEELETAKRRLENCFEAYGGSEFELKEPTAGDAARVNDAVRADTIEDGLRNAEAKADAYRLHTVQTLVCSTPPDAPEHAREFPSPLFEYLYEKANNVDRYGDPDGVDLGNGSLRSAMTATDSSPNS